MSRYTTSILEYCDALRYLAAEANQGLAFGDLSWDGYLITIQQAYNYVFPKDSLAVLPKEYQHPFAYLFMTHYLTDEIGFDTWSMFQFKLRGKLFQYAGYIANIFRLAEKDLFSTFRVRRVSGNELQSRTLGRSTDRRVDHTADYTTDRNSEGSSSSSQSGATNRSGTSLETRNLSDNLTAHLQRVVEGSGSDSGTTDGNTTQKNIRRYSDTPQDELEPIESNAYLTEAEITDVVGTSHGAHTNSRQDTTGTGEDNHEDRTSGGTVGTDDSSKSDSTLAQNGKSDRTEHGTSNSVDATLSDEQQKENSKRDTTWAREEEESKLEYSEMMGMVPVIDKLWPLFDDLFQLLIV